MRTLFEKQVINEYGEAVSSTRITASTHDETFGMHRSTEGVDWVLQFKGIELQMIIFLLELENFKTGIISISSLERKDLLSKFNISLRYYNKILNQLVALETLVKLSSNDYLLNPLYFYKGGTKEWKNKYDFYKRKLAESKDVL